MPKPLFRIRWRLVAAGALLLCAASSAAAQTSAVLPLLAAAPDSSVYAYYAETPTAELLDQARQARLEGDHAYAETLYKAILIRNPNHLDAMLELSDVYESVGKLQYARGLLTRASIIRPYDQDIIDRSTEIVRRLSHKLKLEVDSLLIAGQYQRAVPRIASLLTAQPENADLYYKRALCQLKLGRPDAAMSEIDKALSLKRSEVYDALKDEVKNSIRRRKVRTLESKARRALRAPNPASREAATGYINEILELEPEHAWAREQFVALTGARTDKHAGGGVRGHLAGSWAALSHAARRAGEVAVDVLDIFNAHLELLLSILLVLLVLYSPFTHMLIRGFSPRQLLSGQFKQFTIQEVLTLINTHGGTGVLHVRAPSAKGRVYFESGEVYHCKVRGLEGREALQFLIDGTTDGFFTFCESRGSKHKTIDVPLSLLLLDLPERKQAITAKSILKKQKRRSKMKELLETKR